jgi:predicted metal-dependent HD superfamily phosphohydrolase
MDKQRFLSLCARNAGQASADRFDGWFDTLAGHYREAHRRYHTPVHVEHCLSQFDAARECLEQPDEVEFAVWYHDVIYDTDGTDNELRSAQLFEAQAGELMPSDLVRSVFDLIMVTVHSKHVPTTADQCYMVDIDLSSFGLPWERFVTDSTAVRNEFAQLSDDDFYPSQVRFLRMLLARPNFCLTDFFARRHERQARENISRYLTMLEEQGKARALP